MKSLLATLLTAVLLVISVASVEAQRSRGGGGGSDSEHTMAIKANPITLAFNIYNAGFEKSMGKSSFLVGASYASEILGIDVSSFGADVGYRYYISDGNLEGFYITPKLGFSTGSAGIADASYSTFGLAAELGYQVKTDGGFIFDIGIGPSWNRFGGDYEQAGFDIDEGATSYTSPSATLAIGYAF